MAWNSSSCHRNHQIAAVTLIHHLGNAKRMTWVQLRVTSQLCQILSHAPENNSFLGFGGTLYNHFSLLVFIMIFLFQNWRRHLILCLIFTGLCLMWTFTLVAHVLLQPVQTTRWKSGMLGWIGCCNIIKVSSKRAKTYLLSLLWMAKQTQWRSSLQI